MERTFSSIGVAEVKPRRVIVIPAMPEPGPDEKKCGHCDKIKKKAAFPKNRSRNDGLGGWCSECKNRLGRIDGKYYAKEFDDSSVSELQAIATIVSGDLRCSICKELKLPTEFHKSRIRKNGLHANCKKCSYKLSNEWKKKNPEKRRETYLKWKAANPGYDKKNWEKNKERINKLRREKAKKMRVERM